LAIIKPRIEEILKMVKERLDKLSLSRPLGGGVVLSGGGAQLSGIVELSNRILRLPARAGSPIPIPALGGLVREYRSPAYATAIGLVLEGNDRDLGNSSDRVTESRQSDKSSPDLIGKIRTWLKEEFF
jgi:cell division protein FtsA